MPRAGRGSPRATHRRDRSWLAQSAQIRIAASATASSIGIETPDKATAAISAIAESALPSRSTNMSMTALPLYFCASVSGTYKVSFVACCSE